MKGDFKKNDVKSTLLVKNGLDLDEYFDTNDPFLKSEFSRIIKFNSDPRWRVKLKDKSGTINLIYIRFNESDSSNLLSFEGNLLNKFDSEISNYPIDPSLYFDLDARFESEESNELIVRLIDKDQEQFKKYKFIPCN